MPLVCEPNPAPVDRSPQPLTVELVTGIIFQTIYRRGQAQFEAGGPFGRLPGAVAGGGICGPAIANCSC